MNCREASRSRQGTDAIPAPVPVGSSLHG